MKFCLLFSGKKVKSNLLYKYIPKIPHCEYNKSMVQDSVLNELVRASSRLTGESSFKGLVSVLVEQSADYSRSDLACLYTYTDPETSSGSLKLIYRRGVRDVPGWLSEGLELVDFLEECGEAVVLLSRKSSPFEGLFLSPAMKSGVALPVKSGKRRIGVLILNSREENHYGNKKFRYLDSLNRLAGGLLDNARLMKELKEHLKKINSLERYQESIFRSMTNLLITTDEEGRIQYFNQSSRDTFSLSDDDVGKRFSDVFGSGLEKRTLATIDKAGKKGEEYAGIEGIFKKPGSEEDIDYALNIAPLLGVKGRKEGITLLFTDQTRERNLKAKAEVAVEQRRKIKDMFSRYLSTDIVKSLTENPEMVKLGGDKKTATVFFADITGYTSFSEGKDPEYIIEVLNGFFSEAVEVVISNNGYIDKFIGDCIMAAWGVPMKSEEEDAVMAVTSALQIHELVRSRDRTFFKGNASKLKISIGMSSGPLVAGNIGSKRRMEYTVLGDTVNTAARLESVASAEEVIITRATRDLIGDHFKLEERKPVMVKGKEKPLEIFNVKGINR